MDRAEKSVKSMVDECVKKGQTGFLSKLILKLQKDYIELAHLSSDGQYEDTWTHKNLLDYLTRGEL
jgi:hypothetical protein